MSPRSKIIVGLLALLALAVGLWFFLEKPAPVVSEESGVTYVIKDLTVTKDKEADVQYLELRSGVPQPIRDRVNQELRKEIADNSCFEDSADPTATEDLRSVYRNQLDFQNHTSMSGETLSYSDTAISNWSYAEVVQRLITDFYFYSAVGPMVAYISKDLLSVSIGFDEYCGGAHPNAGSFGRTYDLATGASIPFSGLFSNYTRDKDAIENAIFSYAAQKSPPQDDGSCDYRADWKSGFLNADNISYSLTSEGVSLLSLGYSHAEGPCEPAGDIVVPFSLLKPYLVKSGPVAQLANHSSTTD